MNRTLLQWIILSTRAAFTSTSTFDDDDDDTENDSVLLQQQLQKQIRHHRRISTQSKQGINHRRLCRIFTSHCLIVSILLFITIRFNILRSFSQFTTSFDISNLYSSSDALSKLLLVHSDERYLIEMYPGVVEKIHTAKLDQSIANSSQLSTLLVQPNDFIYYDDGDWDSSPIVLEEFKLIFFTRAKVGCTVWKSLFRRMMHYDDWNVIDSWIKLIPWNPKANGLKYLYHYSTEEASRMLTAKDWTRAIFVRDPKERFVSAYLDKVVNHDSFIFQKCCVAAYRNITGNATSGGDSTIFIQRPKHIRHKKYINTLVLDHFCINYNYLNASRTSPEVFLEHVMPICDDSHWRQQSKRIEDKYWKYINFIGHLETVTNDAERLLKRIGAWELYGSRGWNSNNITNTTKQTTGHRIFAPQQSFGRNHATNAASKLRSTIDTIKLEQLIEKYYADDYNNPSLNCTLNRIFDNHDDNANTVAKTI